MPTTNAVSAGSSSPTLKFTRNTFILKEWRIPLARCLSCLSMPLILIILKAAHNHFLPSPSFFFAFFSAGSFFFLISFFRRPKSHFNLILNFGFSYTSILQIISNGTEKIAIRLANATTSQMTTHKQLYPSYFLLCSFFSVLHRSTVSGIFSANFSTADASPPLIPSTLIPLLSMMTMPTGLMPA